MCNTGYILGYATKMSQLYLNLFGVLKRSKARRSKNHLEAKFWGRISSTFSLLRPLYFDLFANLDLLSVEKYSSM